jgi:hypothetical protein
MAYLRKTHWLTNGHAACGIVGRRRLVTVDPALVTCERCREIRAVPEEQRELAELLSR